MSQNSSENSSSSDTSKVKFDASTMISADYGIFGIPLTAEQSQVILLPVPWEVTTSYGHGASRGPKIIRQASEQIDLFDLELKRNYEAGYHMLPFPQDLCDTNDRMKEVAQKIIHLIANQEADEKTLTALTAQVNQSCKEMTSWVKTQAEKILDDGKLLGLVGGDHSTPLGAIEAVCEKFKGDVGVLHIDAHADLRVAYQGFEQSHASIMYNVMTSASKPAKLVQVGIRDFSEEEYNFSQERPDIKTFFDFDLKKRLLGGESWKALCADILKELPKNVYVSFDIDGLDPAFCPNTGTPVPGGLSVDQVFYLFSELVRTGHKIVAFDLNEVSTGGLAEQQAEWDGNVGARILFKLCGWLVESAKK